MALPSRVMRAGRLLSRGCAALVLISVAYLVVTGGRVWLTATRDERAPADAIVVLGAAQYNGTPSPVFEARLRHAYELWQQGVADVIVTTGGGQHPGCLDGPCYEARAAAEFLYSLGVPELRLDDPGERARGVVREVDGTNTYASMAGVERILDQLGLSGAVLVSDPTHALRALQIAEEVGIDAESSPTRSSPAGTATVLRSGARETAAVALGQVVGYGRLARLEDQLLR